MSFSIATCVLLPEAVVLCVDDISKATSLQFFFVIFWRKFLEKPSDLGWLLIPQNQQIQLVPLDMYEFLCQRKGLEIPMAHTNML